MWTLLADIFGGVLSALTGFFIKRKASSDAVKASNNQATAEAQSGTIRDQADVSVEKARERTDAELAAARDAGLQQQSVDVNAAIAEANRQLR